MRLKKQAKEFEYSYAGQKRRWSSGIEGLQVKIRKYLKGENPNVYYTNSTTLNVAASLSLSDRIKKEGTFHPYMTGGALTHVYLDEDNPDIDALWELTKKITTSTLNSYWSFAKVVLQCPSCDYQAGIDWRTMKFNFVEELSQIPCPRCGYIGVEIFSRITGTFKASQLLIPQSSRNSWTDTDTLSSLNDSTLVC